MLCVILAAAVRFRVPWRPPPTSPTPPSAPPPPPPFPLPLQPPFSALSLQPTLTPRPHSFPYSTPPALTVLALYSSTPLLFIASPPSPHPLPRLLSFPPLRTHTIHRPRWLLLEHRAICRRRWNSIWGLIQTSCLAITFRLIL